MTYNYGDMFEHSCWIILSFAAAFYPPTLHVFRPEVCDFAFDNGDFYMISMHSVVGRKAREAFRTREISKI